MIRYSTALSGLKKAARIASSICGLSNPMLSRFEIASARCAPIVRADGSLNCGAGRGVSVIVTAAAPAPAGDGVEGTALVEVDDDWAGATGAAGVAATAGAGVAGALEVDGAAAVGLGYTGQNLNITHKSISEIPC